MAENKEIKASTEAKRQKKADRRDAKAARKEANKVEEKKRIRIINGDMIRDISMEK